MKVSDPEFKEGLRALFRAVPGLEREQAARDLAQVFIDLAGEYARDRDESPVQTPVGPALRVRVSLFDRNARFEFPDGGVATILGFKTEPKVVRFDGRGGPGFRGVMGDGVEPISFTVLYVKVEHNGQTYIRTFEAVHEGRV